MIKMLVTIPMIVAVLALLFSAYSIYRVGLVEQGLVSEVEQVGLGLRDHVDAELEPLIKKVNKAFGLRGEQGAAAKKLKTAEKYLVQDVLDAENPMVMAALEAVSPRTKEYLEENPELVMQLIPRLKALQSIDGFSPLDLFKPGDTTKTRKHPFGNREE